MLDGILGQLITKVMDREGWYLFPETYVCSLEDYCAAKGVDIKDVEIAPVHGDGISFSWLGMYDAYRSFNRQAKQYDAVTDFREYPGERAFFGIVREWRMEGTGVRVKTPKRV